MYYMNAGPAGAGVESHWRRTGSFRVPFTIGMSRRACAAIFNVSINDYHDDYGCR